MALLIANEATRLTRNNLIKNLNILLKKSGERIENKRNILFARLKEKEELK